MSVKQCPADPSHNIETTWKACSHCGVKLTPDGGAEIGGHDTLRTIAREEAEKVLLEREQKKQQARSQDEPDPMSDFLEVLG